MGYWDDLKKKLKRQPPEPEKPVPVDPLAQHRVRVTPKDLLTDYGETNYGAGDTVEIVGATQSAEGEITTSGAYAVADKRHKPLPQEGPGSVFVPNGTKGQVKSVGTSTAMVLFPSMADKKNPAGKLFHMRKEDVWNISSPFQGGRRRWGRSDVKELSLLLAGYKPASDTLRISARRDSTTKTVVTAEVNPVEQPESKYPTTVTAQQLLPEQTVVEPEPVPSTLVSRGLTLQKAGYQRYKATHNGHKIKISGQTKVEHGSYGAGKRQRRKTTWTVCVDGEEVGFAETLGDARELALLACKDIPKAAAGLVDLKGLEDTIAAPLGEAIKEVAKTIPKDKEGFLAVKNLVDHIEKVIQAFGNKIGLKDNGFFPIRRFEEAREVIDKEEANRLFGRTVIRLDRIGKGNFFLEPQSAHDRPEIHIAVGPLLFRAATNWSSDPTTEVKSILSHELRHAADWAYQTSGSKGLFGRTNPDVGKEQGQEYYNQPTEIYSYAGNVAESIWEIFGNQWQEMSGSELVRTMETKAPRVFRHLKPENRKEFLQRVLKGLEILSRQHEQTLEKVSTRVTAAILEAPPAMMRSLRQIIEQAAAYFARKEVKRRIDVHKDIPRQIIGAEAQLANVENDIRRLGDGEQDEFLLPALGAASRPSFINVWHRPSHASNPGKYQVFMTYEGHREDFQIQDALEFSEAVTRVQKILSEGIERAKKVQEHGDRWIKEYRSFLESLPNTSGLRISNTSDGINDNPVLAEIPIDLAGSRYESIIDTDKMASTIEVKIYPGSHPEHAGTWSSRLGVLSLYLGTIPDDEKSLGRVVEKTIGIGEHELAHTMQTIFEEGRGLSQPGGLPSSKTPYAAYEDQRLEHPQRDIEFYPNLISELHDFRRDLERDPLSNDIEHAEQWRPLGTPPLDPDAAYQKALKDRARRWISENYRFDEVKKRDPKRWRKMVTEFLRAVDESGDPNIREPGWFLDHQERKRKRPVEDKANMAKIPDNVVEKLLQAGYALNAREFKDAGWPDWQSWVRAQTDQQLAIVVENEADIHPSLKQLPQNSYGEWPDMEALIARFRAASGLEYVEPQSDADDETFEEYQKRTRRATRVTAAGDIVLPAGTKLYHGTLEPYAKEENVELKPGGDGVSWFTTYPNVSRAYIPMSGYSMGMGVPWQSPDQKIYPRNDFEHKLLDQMGGFKYEVKEDQYGRPSSWKAVSHPWEQMPTYGHVKNFIEQKLGYDPGDRGFYHLQMNDNQIMPSGWKQEGQLIEVTATAPLRIYDLASERGEGDLMDLEYHRYELFEKLHEMGYDGIKINDFAQLYSEGNVGHESIGLTAEGLKKVQITSNTPSTHPTFDEFMGRKATRVTAEMAVTAELKWQGYRLPGGVKFILKDYHTYAELWAYDDGNWVLRLADIEKPFEGFVEKLEGQAVEPNREQAFWAAVKNLPVWTGQPSYTFEERKKKPAEEEKPYRSPRTPKDLTEKAVKAYGLTDNLALAGYILSDGRMLDFSEGSDIRAQDHRNVTHLFNGSFRTREEGMAKFMKATQSIRVHFNRRDYLLLDFEAPMTDAQAHVIRNILQEYNIRHIEVNAKGQRHELELPTINQIRRITGSVLTIVSEYGGPGPFDLPDEHKAGMEVPKGGSSCSNCKFLSEDKKHCSNEYWQKWAGTDELPAPADEYCSDWFQPTSTTVKQSQVVGKVCPKCKRVVQDSDTFKTKGGERFHVNCMGKIAIRVAMPLPADEELPEGWYVDIRGGDSESDDNNTKRIDLRDNNDMSVAWLYLERTSPGSDTWRISKIKNMDPTGPWGAYVAEKAMEVLSMSGEYLWADTDVTQEGERMWAKNEGRPDLESSQFRDFDNPIFKYQWGKELSNQKWDPKTHPHLWKRYRHKQSTVVKTAARPVSIPMARRVALPERGWETKTKPERLPISTLRAWQPEVDEASSVSSGPISVWRQPSGELVIADGHHRVEEALARGDKDIDAMVYDGPFQDLYASPSMLFRQGEASSQYELEFLGNVEDLDVFKVDGPRIRKEKNVDFTEGGNPSRYPGIVPEGKIYIDNQLEDPVDVAAAIIHEIREHHSMQKGQDYETAHAHAALLESEFRKTVEPSGERTASFEYPIAGSTVSGLTVGKDIPNTGSISASLSEYRILKGIREVPLSAFPGAGRPSYSASEDKRVHDLAEKIKTSGRIDPLIVVIEAQNVAAGPYVLEGGHRLDALHLLGVASLPALVVVDERGSPQELPVSETRPSSVV